MPIIFRTAAAIVVFSGVSLLYIQPQLAVAQGRGGGGRGAGGGTSPPVRSMSPSVSIATSSNTPAANISDSDRERLAIKGDRSTPADKFGDEYTCFLPPLTGVRSSTVAFAALSVQAKAQEEMEKACKSVAGKKFDLAEKQLRKTVEKFPRYSAAWVLLGQLQQQRKDSQKARESCLQAALVNSSYVPAHLCLANIATFVPEWNETLRQSALALALDPTGNSLSYLYNAGAHLSLGHLDEAEKSALKGLDLDKGRTDPRLHYVLAQIYEKKGDSIAQIAQLRKALSLLQNPKDAELVKQDIAEIENARAKARHQSD